MAYLGREYGAYCADIILYSQDLEELGLGKELLKIKLALRDGQMDFFSNEKIEAILEQRPCYFDGLIGI